MKIPPRILIPIVCALLVILVAGFFMFWQLDTTRALLTQGLNLTGKVPQTTEQITPVNVQPIDEGNETLLHMRQGDVMALRGQWSDAMKEYQASVDAGGGLPALRKLAQAQLQLRDVKGARETLNGMKRAGARSEDVLLLESVILLRTGELVKARELLQNAPDSPQKNYGLSLLSIVTGDNDSAKKYLNMVVNGWEPVLRSYARTLLGAYDEYGLFPESPDIHLQTLLARSLAQVQECELALPILTQVTNKQDDYRDAWVVQGFCELSTERFSEALASLERAYSIDPEMPEVQYFLARTYIGLADHNNAITFLQYALQNDFEPASEIHRLLAQEALETGNTQLAFEQYDAMTTDPNADIDAFAQYVSAAITANRKEEAYSKAQEAVTKWPQDARAYDLLGWSALETGRSEEAKTNLEKALSLNPNLESAKEHLKSL